MKFFLCLLATLTLVMNSQSQQVTPGAVNLIVNGNKNLRVLVDGKNIILTGATVSGNSSTIILDRINAGQHNLQITRTNLNTNRQEQVNSAFVLRNGFDLDITVNANGSLELIETRIGGVYNDYPPMSNSSFQTLLRTVRAQRGNAQKVNIETNAFNNTANYFSVDQGNQLLRLIDQEPSRLQLARLLYPKLTDPDNFNQLYILFNTTNVTELSNFVYNYEMSAGDGSGSYNAMSDDDFNRLLNDIRNQWPPSTQLNSILDAFNNTGNYFNCYQASQLIQLQNGESDRLRLAKASYRGIVDRNNFNIIFNLLRFQSSKDDLTNYINNYVGGNGSGYGYNVAMAESDFNRLYEDVKSQWPVTTQLNSATNAFNNPNNFFSAAQVSKILRLFSFDPDKVQLAKASYRGIVDRNNINQVYDCLSFQTSKDELSAYIRNYRDDNNNNNNPGRTPVSDSKFNEIRQSLQGRIFPGEKYSALQDIFNDTRYYFTSQQAKQLIEMVSAENNRLNLAKLSYRSITDRSNFRIVYDLLFLQSSKNELDNYIAAYRD